MEGRASWPARVVSGLDLLRVPGSFCLRLAHALIGAENDEVANVSRILLRYFLAKTLMARRGLKRCSLYVRPYVNQFPG